MQIHHLPVIAVVCALLLLASGCNKDSGPTSSSLPSNTTLTPLTVGNHWDYADSIWSPPGTFMAVDSEFLAITGMTNVMWTGASHPAYDWTWLNKTTKAPIYDSFLMANEAGGTYCYGGVSPKGQFILGRFLETSNSTPVGGAWQKVRVAGGSDSTFFIVDTVQVTLLSLSTPVATPAGTFSCMVMTFQKNGVTTTTYLAPGVGQVGLDVSSAASVTKRRLRAYQLY